MIYEDRLALDTPEGIQLELTLAGVGSRFSAALIDYAFQGLILLALFLVLGLGVGVDPADSGYAAAIFFVAFFVVFEGYNIAFEVLASGRTPGKRWNGLRVVRESGAPVNFGASAVRNVMRLIDFLPGMYLIGITSILITRRNQRLGDLAGGTLVVRDRRVLPPEYIPASRATTPAWDASAIRPDEVDAVVTFLARRHTLPSGARAQVAGELAARLRPRVGGLVDAQTDELFLERLVAAKRGQA